MFRNIPTYFKLARCLAAAALAMHSPLAHGGVIINEIMYHPGPGIPEQTGREYIELLNTGPTVVNLDAFQFDRGIQFLFAEVLLGVGEHLVIAADPVAFAAKYPGVSGVVGPWAGRLSNSGETIRLIDSSGLVVDTVKYSDQGDWANRVRGAFDNGHRGWAWHSAADSEGASLELINPALSNQAGHNWFSSSMPDGTPGIANSVADGDIAPLIRSVAHSPALPTSSDSVVIRANISDELPGSSATLHWRIANTSPGGFESLPMTPPALPTDSTHTVTLNAQPDGTVIEFYIEASDGSLARTWPAATNTGQNANALFQFDDEIYTGQQGIHRLVMSGLEDAEFTSIDRDSNAEMNTTLIADDGTGPVIRYRCGTRVRGASSRSDDPFPLRVNLPRDDSWNGLTEMNLNTQFTYLQFIGLKLMQASGVAAADSQAVQVRRNGANLATSEEEQYGSYVQVQALGGDFIDDKFPTDNSGNLYKKTRPDNSWAYRFGNVASYLNDGWSKSTNSSQNNWGDLDQFLSVMNNARGAPDYLAQVESVADLDQWMRWFAAMTLLTNGETNASNGADDDYSMYSSGIDGRFRFIPHDLDTILGHGDGSRITNPQHTLFDMISDDDVLEPLAPLFADPTIRARYFTALRELVQTSFSKQSFDALLDNHLGYWVPSGTIASIITFMDARRNFVENAITAELGPPLSVIPPTTVGEFTSTHSDLMISEVLAINQAAFANGGTFPDVIELHNAGAIAINLANMAISDDLTEPGKFVIPASTMIDPGGFLLVFADAETTAPGLHLGFGIGGGGDSVHLFASAAGGSPIDSITFGPQIGDLSISRTGATLDIWTLTTPTLGSANGSGLDFGDPTTLRINEWLASPEVRFANEFIELHNPDLAPVALGLMSFTDNAIYAKSPVHLPPLSFIPAGGFAVFEALGDLAEPGDSSQLPFKLNADYDWLSIVGANAVEIDKVHFNNQYADISSGRLPDGSNEIRPLAFPTPGQTNNNQPTSTTAEVIPIDSVWAYEQSNTDLGTAWREVLPIFEDSTWPRGQGILARENSTLPFPIRTILNLNPPTTHYFRQTFNLTAAQAEGSLQFESLVDDGAVFYVNGHELTRIRMPSGVFNHSSFAATSKGNASIEGPFAIPAEFVNPGENLFAAEVHQQDSDSSDVVFGVRTTATAQSIADPEFARALDLLNGLRVSELMYAPTGGRTHEYIELQNIGPVPLELEGVRFTDGIDFTFPQMTLAPGAFVVIVPDQAAFAAQYGAGINVATGSYTGALSNGGEHLQLTLPAPFEAAILSFDYNNSWLPSTDGNGRSMVIAEIDRAARSWNQRESWIASVVDGGSPGTSGPIVITSALSASGTEGFPFNYRIIATNRPTSFGASNLVTGLAIDLATGLITGTPAADGTFMITIQAIGPAGSDSETLTLTLAPQSAPQITSNLIAQAALSVPFTYTINATNNPTSFNASGLPDWLTLDPATGILSGVADAVAGSIITISATNFGGTDTQVLSLNTVTDPLADAIDSIVVALVQGGDADWFAQTAVTHDGVDAATSGNISHDQSSWVEATVIGPDRLSFFWKVSCENFDTLSLSMDAVEQFSINGEVDWETRELIIPTGTHTVRWTYSKDDAGTSGEDRGWLDEIVLENADPTPRIDSPLATTIAFGSEFEYQITATNGPTNFSASPLPIGLTLDPASGRISGTPMVPGITVANITASNDVATGSAALTLEVLAGSEEIFDNTGLDWTYSGGSDWQEQSDVTHDGVDAAESGNIGGNQNSTMYTTVYGPAFIEFWWRVESEVNFDYLNFAVDGQVIDGISGFTGWRPFTYFIDQGQHTLRWRFWKDQLGSSGGDAGWVDEIVIIPDDNDSDGLEDRWEFANFGDLRFDNNSDPDGDGISNLDEFTADTDPNDARSQFKIVSLMQLENGAKDISWISSESRNYIVQSSDDLQSWEDLSLKVRGRVGITTARLLPNGADFETVEFLSENSPLRAIVPNSNIGTLWQGGDEPAFAAAGGDVNWILGTRGVGFENGTGGFQGFFGIDLLGLMRNISSTAYLRVPFTIEDPDKLAALLLQIRYDDAFAAYINGVEVTRSAAAPVALNWQSEATTGSRDDDTSLIGFDINSGIFALRPGQNILAIHGLNAGDGSSDFLITPKILGTTFSVSNSEPPSETFLRIIIAE